jgi:hypothetical protein
MLLYLPSSSMGLVWCGFHDELRVFLLDLLTPTVDLLNLNPNMAHMYIGKDIYDYWRSQTTQRSPHKKEQKRKQKKTLGLVIKNKKTNLVAPKMHWHVVLQQQHALFPV